MYCIALHSPKLHYDNYSMDMDMYLCLSLSVFLSVLSVDNSEGCPDDRDGEG